MYVLQVAVCKRDYYAHTAHEPAASSTALMYATTTCNHEAWHCQKATLPYMQKVLVCTLLSVYYYANAQLSLARLLG
jgi:hypothetical protein